MSELKDWIFEQRDWMFELKDGMFELRDWMFELKDWMFEFWHENRAIYFGLVLVAFLAFISSLSLSERVPIERKGRSFLYFQSFGLQRSSRLKYQFFMYSFRMGALCTAKAIFNTFALFSSNNIFVCFWKWTFWTQANDFFTLDTAIFCRISTRRARTQTLLPFCRHFDAKQVRTAHAYWRTLLTHCCRGFTIIYKLVIACIMKQFFTLCV